VARLWPMGRGPVLSFEPFVWRPLRHLFPIKWFLNLKFGSAGLESPVNITGHPASFCRNNRLGLRPCPGSNGFLQHGEGPGLREDF
jgi:hypothetical protein